MDQDKRKRKQSTIVHAVEEKIKRRREDEVKEDAAK